MKALQLFENFLIFNISSYLNTNFCLDIKDGRVGRLKLKFNTRKNSTEKSLRIKLSYHYRDMTFFIQAYHIFITAD